MSTYHHDSSPTHHAWKAGDVVRLGSWPFADATVLGFNDDGYAKLARPYVYASSVGSVPSPLTGVEIMDMVDLVRSGYECVDHGRIV